MNKKSTSGQGGSYAFGDDVRPSQMKAIVAELGTTCLEIEAGSPHALAVGGCHTKRKW